MLLLPLCRARACARARALSLALSLFLSLSLSRLVISRACCSRSPGWVGVVRCLASTLQPRTGANTSGPLDLLSLTFAHGDGWYACFQAFKFFDTVRPARVCPPSSAARAHLPPRSRARFLARVARAEGGVSHGPAFVPRSIGTCGRTSPPVSPLHSSV